MLLEDFIGFLNQKGLSFRENARSILLPDCPACGEKDYKVYLKKDRTDESTPFFGKCFKCGTKTSSYRYLLDMDIDHKEVKDLHNTGVSLEAFETFDLITGPSATPKAIQKYEPQEHDISHLTRIDIWPTHPASKYATKRGVTPEMYDRVMIYHKANAVVSLCIEDGKVLGYQYRYVTPWNPKMKTWNPPTFQKSNHILEYMNKGDIVVCEGPFTAVAAYHYGYHGVCTFGSAPSIVQMDKILKLAIKDNKNIAIAYDKDASGMDGYFKLISYMKRFGVEVYRIKPETGNDLNDSWMSGKGIIVDKDAKDDYSVPVIKSFPFDEGYEC